MATPTLQVNIPTKPATGIDKLRQMSVANSPKPLKPQPAKEHYIQMMTGNSATPPDPRAKMMSQLDQAKNQLLGMKDIVDKRVAAEQAAKDQAGATEKNGPSDALREMSSALAPQSSQKDFYSGARSAMEEYIKSLMPSREEEDIAKRLSNMRSSVSSGIQQASEQAIPMGFITGQQQAIENRGLNAMQPFSDELERLAAQREAKGKGLSARQEFETALGDTMFADQRDQEAIARDERRYAYQVAKDASAPIEFGGSLYQRNPDGGFTEILSAPPETPEPFELSEGQSRYAFNPETGKYEMIASKGKTYAPGTGSGTTAKQEEITNRVSQIVDGFISFEDLTTAEAQDVRDEMFAMGYGSSEVPEWFKEYQENEVQQSLPPLILQTEWDKHRQEVMSKATAKTKGKPQTLQEQIDADLAAQ